MTAQAAPQKAKEPTIICMKPSWLEPRLSVRERRRVVDFIVSHRHVVLDFSEVETTTGAGLVIVAEWAERARANGGSLVIANCAMPVSVLLGILRIKRAVQVFTNLSDAMASFNRGAKAVTHHAG
jgi:anti-anti-sigma regulatory factor